ncbi:MAG TPA: YicC/YloC family endoribonuclease [Pseudomonadales bacterium]|nr:YicC/YloC family endoribonuclease [Pseudomonadales bacterium]
MIHSMTAFARGERATDQGLLAVEIRTVNHRYLDANLRIPEALRHCESLLRDRLRSQLERGKVDLTVRFERSDAAVDGLALEGPRLDALVAALATVREHLGDGAGAVDPLAVLAWPGIIREAQPDQDALVRDLTALTDGVLAELIAHRRREGARLAELIDGRLDAIEAIVEEVRGHADGLVAALRARLRERARDLAAELEPQRLEQEVALLAQKADIAEELDRLTTHVAEVRRSLAAGGPSGRRLDFLAQELNREANTLASKATQAGVALKAVDLKVLIEQIREQIQNVE